MAEVFFSPTTSMHENLPCGTLIVGVPGAGKSFCLLNLAANALESGCRLFVLDAKNDMLALRNLFPDIIVTDVNEIAPGSLDPFLVFPDIDASIILTIVELLCGDLNSEQKLAVTPIINDFVRRVDNGVGASFRDFSNYLYAHDNPSAQVIGNQLLLMGDSKYGKLLFGEPGIDARGLVINDASRIISIFGMSLPSGSNLPRTDELLNAAVVYIICRMVKDILTRRENNKIPAIFMLDECHMLMRSKAIEDVIDEFLVLGRSLNVSVVLASQNVTHFNRDVAQLVATKFSFRMSKQEAEEFFSLFDNTPQGRELDVQSSVDLITRLSTGNCFVIDKHGRVALVRIDSNYDNGDITSNPLMKKR